MSFMDEYVRRIEQVTIPALRRQLEPLESGAMHTGERNVPGPWVDTTQRDLQRLKQAIAEYESILAKLRNSEIP